MTTEQETDLREALQAAYPAAGPSEALRARVAVLAAQAAPARAQRVKRQRQNRLRLLGTVATLVIVAGFLLSPRLTAVHAYQRMKDSLRDVHTAHLTTWEVLPDGTRHKHVETWYQAGMWRREVGDTQPIGSDFTQICRNGKRWTYNFSSDTVTLEQAVLPTGMEGTTSFAVSAETHHDTINDTFWGLHTQVKMLGATTRGGRPAHILEVVTRQVHDRRTMLDHRTEMVVDDATDLPARQEDQDEKDGRWITKSITEMQYEVPLSAHIFTVDFPKTAQFVDAIAGREQWRERLSKGIASQMARTTSDVITYPDPRDLTHPKRRGSNMPTRIVVRDFQVNARGDVFLLFTANQAVGYEENMVNAQLIDELGTKYINPEKQVRRKFDFVATTAEQTDYSKTDGGYLFNNEVMQGMWWVPIQPQTPWKPRRFTLTMSLPTVGGKGKPAAIFDLPVSKPESENLPSYMPYMSRPLPAAWVESEEIGARADYYQNVAHDLPQALNLYRQRIDLDTAHWKRLGMQPCDPWQWFYVYQVLSEMGRTDEAKAALLRAKADDDRAVSPTETRAWIREEMKKMGIGP